MMNANEVPKALKSLEAVYMTGEVYYKDSNGILHVVDYLYEDEDGNLIMCAFNNKDK